MKKTFFTFFVAVLVAACSSPEKSIDKIAEEFADLECRALELRKNRFALADSFRFSEDTLLKYRDDSLLQKRITTRMQHYEEQKIILVKNSLALADTIRMQLDSLMKHDLAEMARRKLFDEALEKELSKRGCK